MKKGLKYSVMCSYFLKFLLSVKDEMYICLVSVSNMKEINYLLLYIVLYIFVGIKFYELSKNYSFKML